MPAPQLNLKFNGDIWHIAGLDNVVVDMLFHLPQPALGTMAAVVASAQALDYTPIAKVKRNCPFIQQRATPATSLTL